MTRARLLVGALLVVACACAGACGRDEGARVPATAAARADVVAYGFTAGDAPADARLFEAMDFTHGPSAALADPFAALVGLPGARAEATTFRVGSETLVVTRFTTPAARSIPEPSRSNDGWFQHTAVVVSDMDAASARVVQAGGRAISASPQTIPLANPAAGGIRAFYFKDPDGHPLEIIWYPPGKGDARWQDKRRIFLGLDHSAIAVADTVKSRAFYEGLGLHVAGESFNEGPEQEALSGVSGARVRITGLRGASGPGVELLEYVAPRDGRPFPPDARASDLVHWEITIAVDDLDALAARMHAGPIVAVPTPSGERGTTERAALVTDPDGHTVRLVARH